MNINTLKTEIPKASKTNIIVGDILMYLGQIDKRNQDAALKYILQKVERTKPYIVPVQFEMAEKASEYRVDQINHPMLDTDLSDTSQETTTNKTTETVDNYDEKSKEIFKQFLLFDIIQLIILENEFDEQFAVHVGGQVNLPDEVVRAAENARINPESIYVHYSGIKIDLPNSIIQKKDGYEQPYIQIALESTVED